MRQADVFQASWLVRPNAADEYAPFRRARSRKLRRLGFLGLALIALCLCACAGPTWSSSSRADAFYACREAGGDDALCACVTRALQHYAKDPENITVEQAEKSVKVCVPPEDEGEVQKA